MRRQAHMLRPNTRTTRPQAMLFFDCEANIERDGTGSERHTLAFGRYLFWRRRYETSRNPQIVLERFTSGIELADALEKYAAIGKTLYAFAHNLSYDLSLTGLLPELIRRGWGLTYLYAKNRTVILRTKKGKCSLSLLDNLNLFPGALEEWAKVVGIAKIAIDWENPDPELLERRNENDVRIMYECHRRFMAFLDEHDLGDWRPTIASQAFSAYRHRFMTHPIHLHSDPDALAIERAAYGGGIVKVFRRGNFTGQTLVKLDVNSMYPYVMATEEYPTAYVGPLRHPTVERIRWALEHYCVIADVVIKPDAPFYRRRVQSIVLYPMYPFRTVLCTPELQRLLEHNGILEVKRAFLYKKAPIFREYVNYFYTLRGRAKAEGKECESKMFKLFLNSLYGKFAARSGGFVRAPEYDPLASMGITFVVEENGRRFRGYSWGGLAYVDKEGPLAENAFVAIAAHVTAYARMVLASLLERAGLEHIFACDTDGFITDTEGAENLQEQIDPHTLGKLKWEGTATDCQVLGRKFYRWDGRWVAKGCTRVSVQPDLLITYKEEWPTMRKVLHALDAKTPQTIITHKPLKQQFPLYDGDLAPNGQVIPFTSPPPFDPDPMTLQITPELSD